MLLFCQNRSLCLSIGKLGTQVFLVSQIWDILFKSFFYHHIHLFWRSLKEKIHLQFTIYLVEQSDVDGGDTPDTSVNASNKVKICFSSQLISLYHLEKSYSCIFKQHTNDEA